MIPTAESIKVKEVTIISGLNSVSKIPPRHKMSGDAAPLRH